MHTKPYTIEQEEDLFLLPQYQDELCATLPNDIYEHLPEPLKCLFENITNPYERDILLLGSITVLSGCMPNVIDITHG